MKHEKLGPYLFLIAIVLLAGVSLWSIYRAYQSTEYSTAFASALTTFTLVVITAWYAWSTRKLLGATQAQAEATRASFAPHIDGRLTSRGPDFFAVDLVNRGQGVATNIEIEARIYIEPAGDFSLGDRYRFVAHVIPSLPPDTAFGGAPGSGVQIKPRFFTALSEETFKQAFTDQTSDSFVPDVPTDVVNYLSQYLSREDVDPKYPTAVGSINELLEVLRGSDNVIQYPVFELWIRYEDTLGVSKSYEERICKARLDLEKETFQHAFTNMPRIETSRGIRRRLGDHFMRRARALWPSSPGHNDITPAYESDIGAPVVGTHSVETETKSEETNV